MAVLLVSSQPAQASSSTAGSDLVTQYSLQITASATSTSSGSAAASVLEPSGGFADLAVNSAGSPDPAMTYIVGSDLPTVNSTAWQRMSLTATAPIDYDRGEAGQLWNGAAYASVGLRFDSMPTATTAAFDRVQFGSAPSGNLLSRAAAFYDDHMCYESGTNALVTRVTDNPMVGDWSAKVAVYNVGTGTDGWDMSPHTDALADLQTGGGKVTARVSVSTTTPRRWRVRVRAYDVNYNLVFDGLSTAPDNTSQPNGIWSTAQVTVTVPSNAVYAAVTPYMYFDSASPQIGWYYYADGHYLSYNSNATAFRVPAWESPRHLNIRVTPQRVNLLNNPAFNTGTATWGVFAPSGVPYPMSWDSTTGYTSPGSAKFTLAPGTTTQAEVGIGALSGINPGTKGGDMLHTGVPHTLSAWVKVPAGYPPVCASAWDPLAAVYRYGPTSDWIKANQPDLVDGDWVRVYYTWTPPATSTRQFYGGILVSQGTFNSSSLGLSFWVDDMLLEEGTTIGTNFDGSNPSADYVWQGNPNQSATLYFPGRARYATRLTEILQDNVPWGTTFDLLFS